MGYGPGSTRRLALKLLLCSPTLPPDAWSGASRAFLDLIGWARGHAEVRVVAGFRQERAAIPADAVAVDLRHKSQTERRVRFGRAVGEELKRFRPDVVVSRTLRLPFLRRTPLVAVVQQVVRTVPTPRDALWQRAFALAARRCRTVVAPDVTTARHLQRVGLPEGRIRVIPVAVDLESFRPPRPSEVRLDRDPRVHIVVPGRILPEKGQHLALDAVARLPVREKRGVRLTIAGSPGDAVYLDQLRVQGFSQPVEFVIDPPDLASILRDADIVVVPSIVEAGFSATAVEGLSCGKPVVWFDQPAVREATGGHGIAVPAGDVTALRAALRDLLASPEKGHALGAAGRRYVEGNLSWTTAGPRWQSLLSGMV